jgi:hypothetical protein
MPQQFSQREVGNPVQPCARQWPKHWIEIELLGTDGSPVPWEEYRVVPPGGNPIKGYLDENGWARIDGLEDAGACVVSFPHLDKDACRYEAALPACGTSPTSGGTDHSAAKVAA